MKMAIDSILDQSPEVLEHVLVLFEHEREDSLLNITLARNAIQRLEIEIQQMENGIRRSEDYSQIIKANLATRTDGFLRRQYKKPLNEEITPDDHDS